MVTYRAPRRVYGHFQEALSGTHSQLHTHYPLGCGSSPVEDCDAWKCLPVTLGETARPQSWCGDLKSALEGIQPLSRITLGWEHISFTLSLPTGLSRWGLWRIFFLGHSYTSHKRRVPDQRDDVVTYSASLRVMTIMSFTYGDNSYHYLTFWSSPLIMSSLFLNVSKLWYLSIFF